MVVRVLEHIRSASSYEDGDVIFRLIKREIDAERRVEVDFSGVRTVPSAFVNAAFVRLLEEHSLDEVKAKLSFRQSTRQINELIRSRFEFVARQQPSAGSD